MGKLVLGILFVILLQVVFFGFTSRYWSTSNESGLAKSRPNVPQIVRPAEPVQSSPSAASETETPAASQPDEVENRPLVARVRPHVKTESRDRARQSRPRHLTTRTTLVVPARPRQEEEQLSAVAPRRYAVIVTDELARTRTSKSESSEPKKRSFLSKSYSVVVKKPWGWMKSVASKLY
jgi:hypothetical protein